MKPTLDETSDAERMALYRQGLTDARIAKELGLDTSTVRQWRLRRGLETNYRREPMPGGVDAARRAELSRRMVEVHRMRSKEERDRINRKRYEASGEATKWMREITPEAPKLAPDGPVMRAIKRLGEAWKWPLPRSEQEARLALAMVAGESALDRIEHRADG